MPTVAPSSISHSGSIAIRGNAAAMGARGLVPELMDRVLDLLAQARGEMASGRVRKDFEVLHGASCLLRELRSSLDLHGEDVYAANLDDLCEYLSRRLAEANRHNRIATLDEVSHLLREMRSAWLMYV